MKYLKILLLLPFSIYSQIFEHKEGFYYEHPGEDIIECIEVKYLNEEFQTFEKGEICRETQWVREYHQGTVWIPVHTDGTWKPIRNQYGYYWRYLWSEWKFID